MSENKKKKAGKKYHINQSPLYKLKSFVKLANLLKISKDTLKKYKKPNAGNFKVFSLNNREIQEPIGVTYSIHDILSRLLSRIETPKWLQSSKKGCSYKTNAQFHQHSRQVITLDIKSFYQNTTQNMIRLCFLEIFECSPDVAYILSKICCFNNHLPTGSKISIYLSFFANSKMFDEICRIAQLRNASISIYVDDITISGNGVDYSVLNTITKAIERNGHSISQHKTKRFTANRTPIITGVAVSKNSLKPTNKHYKRLRHKIKNLQKNYSHLTKYDLEREGQSIKGYQNFSKSFGAPQPKELRKIIDILDDLLE